MHEGQRWYRIAVYKHMQSNSSKMASISGQNWLAVTGFILQHFKKTDKMCETIFSITSYSRFGPVIPESNKNDYIHNCWDEYYDYRHKYALVEWNISYT